MEVQVQQKLFNDRMAIQKGHRPVEVIPRWKIDGIESMIVEGVETYLGEVRNFKSHITLQTGLPAHLSMSWTKMPAGRELPEHFHPCPSMIIVTRGRGQSTGDTQIEIEEGDVIWIPEWNSHGFKGLGEFGFEALSVQFQKTAIFESVDFPETTYQELQKTPLDERQLKVIGRLSLPALNELQTENGEVKNLGVVKGFSGHPLLKEKCPDFFSAAWVQLQGGQRLEPHVHDVDSMIIVTNGEGRLLGSESMNLKTGDTVFVPKGQSHGFEGVGDGFWGLSIQFEPESLYDARDDRNVRFLSPYDQFLEKNEQLAQEFHNNPVFQISSAELEENPSKRTALLDCLQVMSNHFQRLMYARMALSDREEYHSVFLEHFLEELGHNQDLATERGRVSPGWNPILEASASWFVFKNTLLDDPSRIVMIQMVLEKGASVFYSHFSKILMGDMKSDHILKHCDADEGHD
ncbi:MAG: cupin domain-containing protein, partial [Pseudomonadota bacterium]